MDREIEGFSILILVSMSYFVNKFVGMIAGRHNNTKSSRDPIYELFGDNLQTNYVRHVQFAVILARLFFVHRRDGNFFPGLRNEPASISNRLIHSTRSSWYFSHRSCRARAKRGGRERKISFIRQASSVEMDEKAIQNLR
jgi:hypothetical protein